MRLWQEFRPSQALTSGEKSTVAFALPLIARHVSPGTHVQLSASGRSGSQPDCHVDRRFHEPGPRTPCVSTSLRTSLEGPVRGTIHFRCKRGRLGKKAVPPERQSMSTISRKRHWASCFGVRPPGRGPGTGLVRRGHSSTLSGRLVRRILRNPVRQSQSRGLWISAAIATARFLTTVTGDTLRGRTRDLPATAWRLVRLMPSRAMAALPGLLVHLPACPAPAPCASACAHRRHVIPV